MWWIEYKFFREEIKNDYYSPGLRPRILVPFLEVEEMEEKISSGKISKSMF